MIDAGTKFCYSADIVVDSDDIKYSQKEKDEAFLAATQRPAVKDKICTIYSCLPEWFESLEYFRNAFMKINWDQIAKIVLDELSEMEYFELLGDKDSQNRSMSWILDDPEIKMEIAALLPWNKVITVTPCKKYSIRIESDLYDDLEKWVKTFNMPMGMILQIYFTKHMMNLRDFATCGSAGIPYLKTALKQYGTWMEIRDKKIKYIAELIESKQPDHNMWVKEQLIKEDEEAEKKGV